MQTISELEQELRRLINIPRKQYSLLKDTASWNMLCSCLDTIGDTEFAIDSYLKKADVSDTGEKYLIVYGVLQALFIQQDATKNLAEALGIEFNPEPFLSNIREIRNASIGHPTKHNVKKTVMYNFITRPSLSTKGFTLITTFSHEGGPKFSRIDILDLISKQRTSLQKILSQMISKLKEDEMAHRRKFKDENLQDIFPPTLAYFFEKVFAACYDDAESPLAPGAFEIIAEVIEKFKNALQKRGLLESTDHMAYLFDQVEYPIVELRGCFENPPTSTLNKKSAYIFVFFVQKKLEEMLQIAKEIDDEYNSEV